MVKRYFVGGAGVCINQQRSLALVLAILGHSWLRGLHNHQRIAVVKEDNMNQKYNPFVSLVALLLLALILVLTCTGCTAAAGESTKADLYKVTKNSDRFAIERYFNGSHPDCYVITDNDTGAQYLYVADSYGSGLTKMEG